MSSRRGVIGTVKVPLPEIPEPNRHIPFITAECRVFFPPNATREQILTAMGDALAEAVAKLENVPPYRPKIWLTWS